MEGRHVDPLGAVYAEALAEVAEAEGGLELVKDVGERLWSLGGAWNTDRTLRAYFMSAEVPSREKEASLDKLASEQPKVLGNFLRLLHRRGRLHILPLVADAFEAILDKLLGRVPVTLSTATVVPEDMMNKWVDQLRTATGKEPLLRHVVRPELVAGAVLQVGGRVVDGSSRRRIADFLKQMKERAKHEVQA